ncbi:MAG: ATP-binding protein [Gemmatimonadota bacterium]
MERLPDTAHEVTEPVQLREQLELYREVIANAQDAVAIFDLEGRYVDHNPAHSRLLGYSLEELVGHRPALHCDQATTDRLLRELRESGSFQGEVISRTKAGAEVQLELSAFAVRDSKGEARCYVGFARDITSRKLAERRRQVLQRAREEVLLMSAEADIDKVVAAIRHALDALGIRYLHCGINVLDVAADPPTMRSRTSVPGGGWLNTDTSRSALVVMEIWRGGQPRYRRDLEAEDTNAERSYLQRHARVRAVLDVPFSRGTLAVNSVEPEAFSDADVAAVQELAEVLSEGYRRMEDIARLKRAVTELEAANRELLQTQNRLVRSEKMAALGSLVAGIAHEINTPVGAIRSMHETLMRAVERLKGTLEVELPEACAHDQSLQKALKIIGDSNRVIETGAERVATIVRSLRNFARLDDACLEEADLHEGLDDSLLLIHHDVKNRIEVVREYGQIPRLKCYPGRLNQVFLNILNNAQQAIEGKGCIAVRTWRDGDWVRVAISDTGSGIAADRLGKIFDPGYTTKGVGVGTGLGLSICYQIMQDHHGRIEVASEVGKGSTFTVVVPVEPPGT